MIEYFPEPKSLGKVKVGLDLFNYATKMQRSKKDIANFVNKTDFDNKLKDATSNKNESNELSKKLKQYQQKDEEKI